MVKKTHNGKLQVMETNPHDVLTRLLKTMGTQPLGMAGCMDTWLVRKMAN